MPLSPFQTSLLQTYGDSAVDFEKSHVLIRHSPIYLNGITELFIYFDMRNKHGLRVASLPAAALVSRLSCFLDSPPNHTALVLLESSRPGLIRTQFTAEQSIAPQFLRLYYCDKLVHERAIQPRDSWQNSNKAIFREQSITSHSQAVFYSNRVLFNGVGDFAIHLSDASLVGLCLREQRGVVYGQTAGPGLVRLSSDGKVLSIIQKDSKRQIQGIDGRDCVAFVRLRPGKSAEFVQFDDSRLKPQSNDKLGHQRE